MSESMKQRHPEELVFEIIRSYHPDLTEKEFEVCKNVATTMWDFHADSADYEEVVARWPDLMHLGPKNYARRSLFTVQDEYSSTIASLVAKGVLAESLNGGDDERFRNLRILTFSRNDLFKRMQIARIELGCEY